MKRKIIVVSILLALLFITPVHAEDCTPTQPMFQGTHHKPITQKKEELGKGLIVTGRILSTKGCKSIKGAKVAHWQAGDQGRYIDELRAYSYSKHDGDYYFSTQRPAAMSPHIHFTVTANGYKSVTTQWVGDEVVSNIVFDIVLENE